MGRTASQRVNKVERVRVCVCVCVCGVASYLAFLRPPPQPPTPPPTPSPEQSESLLSLPPPSSSHSHFSLPSPPLPPALRARAGPERWQKLENKHVMGKTYKFSAWRERLQSGARIPRGWEVVKKFHSRFYTTLGLRRSLPT